MSQNDITALFDQWNAAIQTGDPKTVAALYESNGILLPRYPIKFGTIMKKSKTILYAFLRMVR